MSADQRIPVRVDIMIAREAPTAVVVVRARSKLVHFLRWNLQDNSVEHGSWFQGRIYTERGDLSYDGKYMIYNALNPADKMYSWTAISEPPWVKALLLWQHSSTWVGGGVFAGRDRVWLDFGWLGGRKKITNELIERQFQIEQRRFWKPRPPRGCRLPIELDDTVISIKNGVICRRKNGESETAQPSFMLDCNTFSPPDRDAGVPGGA